MCLKDMCFFYHLLLVSLALASESEYDPKYSENFFKGYFPFEDLSQPTTKVDEMLDKRQKCSHIFDDYLKEESQNLSLTPGDVPMKVAVLFVITQIHDVNERDQAITMTSFIEISWRDRRLANIGGDECTNITKVVRNFHERIFFPMFTIENAADRVLHEEAWEKFPAVVYHTGVVVWISSLRLNLNCKMNMRIFPYDSQNCVIVVRSPHYSLSELQYYVYSRSAALLLWDDDVSNPLWQLTGQMPRLMNSNMSGLEIWFKLERKPSFYIWTLVIPTGIISIATCLSFSLPYDSGEKMQTMLTGILAYYLLLLTMVEVTPQASDNIPVLTLFFVIVIGVAMLGAVACAFVIRLHSRSLQRQRKSQQTSPVHLHFCNTAAIFNDVFLITYIAALGACYTGLFVYINMVQGELDDINASMFNYTGVMSFNQK